MLKLHELISANDNDRTAILIDEIVRYKRSLQTYYGYHNSPLILMVTDVFNTCSYAKVVSASEFSERVYDYVETIPDLTDEERERERELINFQSIPFEKL